VIVLNYDGLEHLEPCFASLGRVDYPAEALELMLFDNGSTDGSVPFVREAFPEVRIVEAGRNLGFAAGNNRAAAQSEADYAVFLNNDTTVEPGFVRALVDAVSSGERVVSAGARILDWSGKRFDYAGSWINIFGHGAQRGFHERFAEDRYDRLEPTAFACGGAMIVDRAVFLDVGGFDEDYFAVLEDVDLGWRLWLYGHEVVYAPDAVVHHRHHGTIDRIASHVRAARARHNALVTIFKNYDDVNMPRAVAAATLASAAGVVETVTLDGRMSHRTSARRRPAAGASLTPDETATMLALRKLVADLPRLREKRDEVQRRRVRSDRELAHHFPLLDPTAPRASVTVRSTVASAFGFTELYHDSPRKILVFAPDLLPLPGFPTVGSGLRAWGLGQGLAARGHDVVFSMPRLALQRLDGRYPIGRELRELAWAPYAMHRIVERVEPDVVLVCGWPLAEGLSQRGLTTAPVVVDQHGPHILERRFQGLGDESGNRRQKLDALASADYFTCAGERQLEYFQPWLADAGWTERDRRERSFATRFSLSPEAPERRPSDGVTFVYGGVWLPWQDPTAGLRALVRQLDRRGRGTLRLFGGRHPWLDIDGGAFEKLVAELEASPHVIQEGQVPHARLIESYSRAHVALDLMKRNPERELAVTSRTVEFLWCGLPVIYNDYSELSELIRDYDAGWTVDPEDAEAIDRALDEAFDDPDAIRRKSDNARRLVREQLSWVETIEPLDSIVREATRRAGARPMPRMIPDPPPPRKPTLAVRMREAYREVGATGIAGRGVRGAAAKLHLDHPRNGREPTALQKLVWVSLHEGPREAVRKAVRRG
jgi:GT2 family glycosyltransferase